MPKGLSIRQIAAKLGIGTGMAAAADTSGARQKFLTAFWNRLCWPVVLYNQKYPHRLPGSAQRVEE
jgi:hypothetical protein